MPFAVDLPSGAVEVPWTISYVLRKQQQIDSYREMEKSKRPPDKMIWWGKPEDLEKWFDTVYGRKKKEEATFDFDPRDVG